MEKLKLVYFFLGVIFLAALCFALPTVYNPYTSKLDFYGLKNFSCAAGQFLNGFDLNSTGVCAAPTVVSSGNYSNFSNYSYFSNSSTFWAGVSNFNGMYLIKSGLNVTVNETYLNSTIVSRGLSAGFNSTFNSTYAAKADYAFNSNNFNGSGNISTSGKLCLTNVGTCLKYIWYNGTDIVIQG